MNTVGTYCCDANYLDAGNTVMKGEDNSTYIANDIEVCRYKADFFDRSSVLCHAYKANSMTNS